jgi:hypothetical protein
MDSTAKRPSSFHVAAVVSFYMFAALVVRHLCVLLFIGAAADTPISPQMVFV